ncbi:MAG: hypothetical protein H6544_07890 [Prevotellaceae bacterium]|nr:hypothetical protein [Prevotellaceae bacterium]
MAAIRILLALPNGGATQSGQAELFRPHVGLLMLRTDQPPRQRAGGGRRPKVCGRHRLLELFVCGKLKFDYPYDSLKRHD